MNYPIFVGDLFLLSLVGSTGRFLGGRTSQHFIIRKSDLDIYEMPRSAIVCLGYNDITDLPYTDLKGFSDRLAVTCKQLIKCQFKVTLIIPISPPFIDEEKKRIDYTEHIELIHNAYNDAAFYYDLEILDMNKCQFDRNIYGLSPKGQREAGYWLRTLQTDETF